MTGVWRSIRGSVALKLIIGQCWLISRCHATALWHGAFYQEYTLTQCIHSHQTIISLCTHTVAGKQSKLWMRWPSIRRLADHVKPCKARWVGDWTLEHWWWHGGAHLTMSPLHFRASLVRNTICLVSTIYSPPDISLFSLWSLGRLWGGGKSWWCRQLSEKSKQTSAAGFDFLWVTADLGAPIHSGQGYQWFKGHNGETTCILI